MHASPTFKFLLMLQYSHSFEYVLIYFVSHKIGLKVLSGFSELDYHFQKLKYDVFFGVTLRGIPCRQHSGQLKACFPDDE